MSISLNKTFNAFRNYDKVNVLHYILTLSLLAFLCLLINPQTIAGIVCFSIIGLIAFAIYAGYYVVASHNEILNRKNIFPSIKELPTIVIEGMKYGFGYTILNILFYVIPISIISFIGFFAAVSFLEKKSYLIGGSFIIITVVLCLAIIIALMYFYFMPLCIMYLKSLNFASFFAFNKTKIFIKQKGTQMRVYFLFSILIAVLINIFSTAIVLIPKTAGLIKNIQNVDYYSNVISLFVTAILQTLLMPNLNGQIARYNIAEEESIIENFEEYYDEDEYEEMFNDEYEEETEQVEETVEETEEETPESQETEEDV